MQITRTARSDRMEIKLKGRMDATWSDHVARALAECIQSGQHAIALDMAEVEYLSSAGIRVLLVQTRQLAAIQGRLVVINASNVVRKVLELAGLDKLLLAALPPEAESAPPGEATMTQAALEELGAAGQVFELDPQATLQIEWPGEPAAWFTEPARPGTRVPLEFPSDVIGLGLGALGSGEAAEPQPLGEFLAAAGVAVCQPADGSNKPDYVLSRESLIPIVNVAYGMLGRGGFRRLLRFDQGPQQTSLPLSKLVRACLSTLGSEAAGLVLVAETASLIGASLQKSPDCEPGANQPRDIFAFPQIRDWLSFTTEAAFVKSTSIIVGFAATKALAPRLRLLKPLLPAGDLMATFMPPRFLIARSARARSTWLPRSSHCSKANRSSACFICSMIGASRAGRARAASCVAPAGAPR